MAPARIDQFTRVIGGLLCATAVLKFVDALNPPAPGRDLALSLIGSCVELTIGVALVFRIRSRLSTPAAGFLLVFLGGVSLVGTIRGVANCRCLGEIEFPPWALLIFDLATAALLLSRPLAASANRHKWAIALGTACVAAFAAGIRIGSIIYPPSQPLATASSAREAAAAKIVSIDPVVIRNSPLFLLQSIRIDADLSRGEWKIILARPGCKRCEQFMKSGHCKPDGSERVAVVLSEKAESWALPPECKAVVGYLSGDKIWHFQAPFMFKMTDGRVAGGL